MVNVSISIQGYAPFRCPVGWTAGEAKIEIRSRYVLDGGGIDKNDAGMRENDIITSDGEYEFVNFQPRQGNGYYID